MVTSKQRKRQLARAKWQRQQTRRTASAHRRRTFQIVAGMVVGLVAVAAVVWFVLAVVGEDDTSTPQPSTPGQTVVTQPPGESAPTPTEQGSAPTGPSQAPQTPTPTKAPPTKTQGTAPTQGD